MPGTWEARLKTGTVSSKPGLLVTLIKNLLCTTRKTVENAVIDASDCRMNQFCKPNFKIATRKMVNEENKLVFW